MHQLLPYLPDPPLQCQRMARTTSALVCWPFESAQVCARIYFCSSSRAHKWLDWCRSWNGLGTRCPSSRSHKASIGISTSITEVYQQPREYAAESILVVAICGPRVWQERNLDWCSWWWSRQPSLELSGQFVCCSPIMIQHFTDRFDHQRCFAYFQYIGHRISENWSGYGRSGWYGKWSSNGESGHDPSSRWTCTINIKPFIAE